MLRVSRLSGQKQEREDPADYPHILQFFSPTVTLPARLQSLRPPRGSPSSHSEPQKLQPHPLHLQLLSPLKNHDHWAPGRRTLRSPCLTGLANKCSSASPADWGLRQLLIESTWAKPVLWIFLHFTCSVYFTSTLIEDMFAAWLVLWEIESGSVLRVHISSFCGSPSLF